ncbi:MAG: ABC transporter permease [Alphaproteobacteria bacterium]|nr:ABC transporter permease [Alphaproteobacteria bacterium]
MTVNGAPTGYDVPAAGGLGLRHLARSPAALIGLAIIVFWVIVAIAAPWLAPHPPNTPLQALLPPGSETARGAFWLGTDQLGRDILSRVIWGSRRVLLYAPLATAFAYAIGITIGLMAGYWRGWIDQALSRVSDVVLAFPVLVLYILIITTIGASGLNIVIAVVFASTPGVMRIVRGLTLDARGRNYVAAAQMRGEHPLAIMFVEILPNVRGPLIVDACLRMGYVTIGIGVLGFLGLGLPPPDPDWGGMVHEARALAFVFPHIVLFPCAAISSLVLGFNLLADGLRELGRQ